MDLTETKITTDNQLPTGFKVKLKKEFYNLYIEKDKSVLSRERPDDYINRMNLQEECNKMYKGELVVTEHKIRDFDDKNKSVHIYYFLQFPNNPHLASHFENV